MQILSVHNSYQIRGGEEESRDAEERLLRDMGHQVYTHEESNARIATLGSANLALRTIWSFESFQTVRQKLQQTRCDLVHVQNFFPLISPSVYYAAKAEGVPVVQTIRNYRLLCPNALFFRNGEVCEDCLGKAIPWPSMVHGCYRKNRLATAGVAAMLTTHRALNTWANRVDVYIALTEFARQKLILGGLPAEKIVVKPNFIHPDPGSGAGSGGYALYVGRLSVEKGLDTLLEAWQSLPSPLPLKIVGDGPLGGLVTDAAKRLPQIEWLGRKSMPAVYELMGEAKMLIFPSKWYETFGRVAIEAFAKGTPVIASKIGAIAELIDDGRTGLLFNPGDAQDLTTKINLALAHPHLLKQMRHEVRAEFEAKYRAEVNYHQLKEIYARVLAKPWSTRTRASLMV
jgi:glycosyltransferase involved in cell wall biosynthesis